MITRNKKGFFFTLDSILSLVILIMLLIFSYNFINSNVSKADFSTALFLAKDVSLVLVESEILYDDLNSSNYYRTSKYLNASIPSQFGGYVRITKNSGASFNISGPSCKLQKSFHYKQPIYANQNFIYEVIIC